MNSNLTFKSNELVKDFSLYSGERQIGNTIDNIRRDHVLRYEFALLYLDREYGLSPLVCMDVFCGNGYGSFMASSSRPFSYVIGIDASREAIDLANEFYSLSNNIFTTKLYPFDIPKNTFDCVMCFESLEHVETDKHFIEAICESLKDSGVAFVSVPNQAKHPLEKNPHPFHYRHYLHEDLLEMIPSGIQIDTWYGQDVYIFSEDGINTSNLLAEADMNLKEKIHGQVNIYVLRKRSIC